jgi:CheY-like chemotaxis protein
MLRILLVDDDAVALMLHSKVLEKAQLNLPVHQFKKGIEALDFLKSPLSEPTDFLLLLDINMPEMSGWEVLEVLSRSHFPFNIFVFMVTSSVDQSDRVKAENNNLVMGYIEKPFSKITLEGIRNHEALQQYFPQTS